MGIFNYVDFEMSCPKCGTKMKNFQTKDGDLYMATVPWWEVNNFYDSCGKCGAWVEFHRKIRELVRADVDKYFDMVVETEQERKKRWVE